MKFHFVEEHQVLNITLFYKILFYQLQILTITITEILMAIPFYI